MEFIIGSPTPGFKQIRQKKPVQGPGSLRLRDVFRQLLTGQVKAAAGTLAASGVPPLPSSGKQRRGKVKEKWWW